MYQPPHRRRPGSQRSGSPLARDARSSPPTTTASAPPSRQPFSTSSATSPTVPGTHSFPAVTRNHRTGSLTPVPSQRPTSTRLMSAPGPAPFVRRTSRQPAPSEMEMLASVSRSGGDGAEGDALKDFGTQVRFRAYIDEKIHQYHLVEDEAAVKNIVRLFRKLREGIVASGRLDRFSIEVFESSVRYSVIAKDAPQLLSALSGLVPELYLAVDAASAERARTNRPDTPQDRDSCELDGMFSKFEMLRTSSKHSRHSHDHGHGHAHGSDTDSVVGEDAPDNRSHFASLLLIYHLIHSSREVFAATYNSLVAPLPRALVQWDYASEMLADHDADADAGQRPHVGKRISAPAAQRTPFTTPANLAFARAAASAMAPESLDPLLFGRMVAGTSVHPSYPHDHPAALERALLAWGSGRVRTEAGERLKKAYVSAGTGWAAEVLNLQGDGGVMLWAMANGASVMDGVVKLR